MKHFTAMKSPYEAVVWIAGMIAGSITYLRTNLDLLDVSVITWEKILGLAWGLVVAFMTGMFAVFGKRLADVIMKRFFKRKQN